MSYITPFLNGLLIVMIPTNVILTILSVFMGYSEYLDLRLIVALWMIICSMLFINLTVSNYEIKQLKKQLLYEELQQKGRD